MRILIIRPSSIGDVVMASPVLRALKEGYRPRQVTIHWLIDQALVSLLEANPFVDQVIPWDKAKWKGLLGPKGLVRLFHEIRSFTAVLRGQRYDLALDLQGLLRSRCLAYLSGARERIGFDSREPGHFLMTRIVSKGPQDTMMGSEYLFLMEELGFPVQDPAPSIFIPYDAPKKARSMIEGLGIRGAFVALAPFTTRPQKHWLQQRWSALASSISRQFGLPSVILGGPQDKSAAREIADAAAGDVVSLAGRLRLMESAAVVAMARVLIGVDTGLTHMGTALKTPTIALFGATRPYLKASRPTTRILYHGLPCSPCKRRPTCSDFKCMKSITCDEIIDTVGGLIETD